MAHDVFISHSHLDKTLADAVCARLEAHGLRCWIAPRDVSPGADWADAIVEAIGSARVFVLIFSGSALASEQVKREITLAADQQLIIMPVRKEKIIPTGMFKFYLSDRHWLDVIDGPMDEHLTTLAHTIARVLGKPKLTEPAELASLEQQPEPVIEPGVDTPVVKIQPPPPVKAKRSEPVSEPLAVPPSPTSSPPQVKAAEPASQPPAEPTAPTDPWASKNNEIKKLRAAERSQRTFYVVRLILTMVAVGIAFAAGGWAVAHLSSRHGDIVRSPGMTALGNRRAPSASSNAYTAPKDGDVKIKTKINPKDGAEMVWIPPGSFLMGDNDQKDNPRHSVTLSGYWIYKNLVTVGQYKKYVAAKAAGKVLKMPQAPTFDPKWAKLDHPIVNVSWDDAKAYCAWANVSLPTEAQWEKAARGTDGRKYPWGNAWDVSKCANSAVEALNGTVTVGVYHDSPYELSDMAGNVWQWCADPYDANYMKISPANDPQGPATGKGHVQRGGSWDDDYQDNFRTALRDSDQTNFRRPNVGFRCASGQ